ncbi:unnamed protein product [Mucor hiemalis]
MKRQVSSIVLLQDIELAPSKNPGNFVNSPLIPENSYNHVINVAPDGNCYFRALAVELFGKEDAYIRVKQLMRDMFSNNYEMYQRLFPSPRFDLERSRRIICSGFNPKKGSLETATTENDLDFRWMYVPDCARIAADTFGRPVGVYFSHPFADCSLNCLLILTKDKYEPETGPTPLPLVLQNINNDHCITLKMKRSIKVTWPRIPEAHSKWMQT